MSTTTVTKTLASGALGPGTAARVGQLESTLPEGTPCELVIHTKGITLTQTVLAAVAGPVGFALGFLTGGSQVVSSATVAQGMADLVNKLGQSGGPLAHVSRQHGHALATSQGGAIHIRWVKESTASDVILSTLAALTAGALAALVTEFSWPVIVAAAVAVGGLLFLALTAFQFLATVTTDVGKAIGTLTGGSVWGDLALIGGGVFAIILIARGI